MRTEDLINQKIIERDDFTLSTLFKPNIFLSKIDSSILMPPFNRLIQKEKKENKTAIDYKEMIEIIKEIDINFYFVKRRVIMNCRHCSETIEMVKYLSNLFNEDFFRPVVGNLLLFFYLKVENFQLFSNLIAVIDELNIFEKENQIKSPTDNANQDDRELNERNRVMRTTNFNNDTLYDKVKKKEEITCSTSEIQLSNTFLNNKIDQITKNSNKKSFFKDRTKDFHNIGLKFQSKKNKFNDDLKHKFKYKHNLIEKSKWNTNFSGKNLDQLEQDHFFIPFKSKSIHSTFTSDDEDSIRSKKLSKRNKKDKFNRKKYHKSENNYINCYNSNIKVFQKDKIIFMTFKAYSYFYNKNYKKAEFFLEKLLKFKILRERKIICNEIIELYSVTTFINDKNNFCYSPILRNLMCLVQKCKLNELQHFTDSVVGFDFFMKAVRNLVKFCYEQFSFDHKLELKWIKAGFVLNGFCDDDWIFYLFKIITNGLIKGYVSMNKEVLVFSKTDPFPGILDA